MSIERFVVLAVISVVVTVPTLVLVRRARSSPLFERVLWLAALVVAFLTGWLGVLFASGLAAFPTDSLQVGGTPLVPAFLGALLGGLALTLPLGLMDRLEGRREEDELEMNDADVE